MADIFFSSRFFPSKTSHSLSKPQEPVAFFSFYLKQYFFLNTPAVYVALELSTLAATHLRISILLIIHGTLLISLPPNKSYRAFYVISSDIRKYISNRFHFQPHYYSYVFAFFFSFVSSRKFICCCLVSKNIEIIINFFFVKYLVLNPIYHSD